MASTASAPTPVLASDRRSPLGWQGRGGVPDDGDGDGQLWDWAQARRGLRLRTLVLLRWVAIACQLAALLWVTFGLRLHLPLAWCLLTIALAAWMNLSLTLAWPGMRLARRREALYQLGFDLVQLAVLLGLTGGLENPFALCLHPVRLRPCGDRSTMAGLSPPALACA